MHQLVLQDRQIETTLGISGTSIHSILHEHLTVKKIFSRWIPHNFSIAQKKARVNWSKEMLPKYDRGASKHVYDIVTGDESWIYAYELECKYQSTLWESQSSMTDHASPRQCELSLTHRLKQLHF